MSELPSLIQQASDAKISEYMITSMILNRQQGLRPYDRFSSNYKCNIANRYLPNEMLTLCRYDVEVYCGIYSKNGDYFVTASRGRQIRLFKSNDNLYKPVKSLDTYDGIWAPIDVAFTPDQQHLVYTTSSSSGNLQMCSVQGDDSSRPLRLVQTRTGSMFRVCCVISSSDGREIIGGGNDGCIYGLDIQRNDNTLSIQASEDPLYAVALADESPKVIFSGGHDGLIKVWDRRILNESYPRPVGMLAGHKSGVTCIDSRGDGRHLISNSTDQSIKMWDVRVFSGNDAIYNTIKAARQYDWYYYRLEEYPRIFHENRRTEDESKSKLDGDTSIMTYKGHLVNRGPMRCRFSPAATTGQRYIYTGCGFGRVHIYDALTGKTKRELSGHCGTVRDVAWHPYKNEIISSGLDGVVRRWIYKGKELPLDL